MAAAPVWADDDAPTTQPSAETDVGDLWRRLRDKDPPAEDGGRKFLVLTPSIGSKPSTGLSAGFASHMAFFLGDPGTSA